MLCPEYIKLTHVVGSNIIRSILDYTQTWTRTHTYTHTHTHTHTHTQSLTWAHTHTHLSSHAHAHSHIHTHTQNYEWCKDYHLHGHVPPVPKDQYPGHYTGTLSQCIGIYFPGARLGTHRKHWQCYWTGVGTQSSTRTTPDLHCQWDLMLLPSLSSQPKPGPYFTARDAEAMGMKWLAQGHNSKVQVVTRIHNSWVGSTRPQLGFCKLC